MFVAGVGLIDMSRLMKWEPSGCFSAPIDTYFEEKWLEMGYAFGRVALWNMFSTGAEYLLKGVLLANEIESVRRIQWVSAYPEISDGNQLAEWARQYRLTQETQTNPVPTYGTLGGIICKPREKKKRKTLDEEGVTATAASTPLEILFDMKRKDENSKVKKDCSKREQIWSSLHST